MEREVEFKIRWMRREDLPLAVEIMKSSGMEADQRRMERIVSKVSMVCMVAESEEKVAGILVYDIGRVSKIKMVALAVREDLRRKGLGRELVGTVVSKLNKRRNKLETSVSEYNLGAQLFLRAMGFKAVSVVENEAEPSEYRFLYKFEGDSPEEG